MKLVRKILLSLCMAALLWGGISVGSRALPISYKKELCKRIVSKKSVFRCLALPTPDWAQKQLDADFRGFEGRKVTAAAVAKLYQEIRAKIGQQILHYRILDNKLYKYIPNGAEYSSVDTRFERAFKTLLHYKTNVPDLDFLLCPMDGIPEPYVPQDFFLSSSTEGQVPLLGQAKRKEPASQYIVLIPDQFSLTESWREDIKEVERDHRDISWNEKKESALWRGNLTDVGMPGDYSPHLRECPRFKISELSVQHPQLVNAGICSADSPETISALSHAHVIRGPRSKRDHLHHKYLPVLDGHMCTYPGYQWRLLSNSVAFKQESDQIQWFYGGLEPYQHYVPIRNDLSDLLSQIDWAKAHDGDAQAISARAQEFAQHNLLPCHIYAYLHRVFTRYAASQEIDFQELKKATRQDPKWECIQYRKRTHLMRTIRKLMQFGRPLAGEGSCPWFSNQTVQCKAALQGSL